MEIYNRLIENPLFFKWIYHSSEEIESYWKQYLDSNPNEAEQILEFKSQFEKHLQYKKEQLSDFEKKALAQRIINQIEKVDKTNNRRTYIKIAMRYAAVAILFFSIGSSLVYLYMEGTQQNVLVDNISVPSNLQEPTLIIDDKQKIQLNEGESEIDYTNKGTIVINKDNVIQEEMEEPTMNTLIIPYGSRSTITLADGSKVWLNAGSKLIYPSRFVDKKREVYLVGEAFFDIEKNEKMPFVVRSSFVEVEVLGTRFNVSAYPEDNSVQTVLVEGSVNVKSTDAGIFEKGITLVPGQLALLNKSTEKTKIYDVDTDYYTLWIDGLFSFTNTDLNRLVKKLERYYNISFNYSDPLDGTIKVSGKLDVTKGKKEVFEYLTLLTGLQFEKINERRYEIK
jgi:hypothetical protein